MSVGCQNRKCLRWRGMSVLPPSADAARPFAPVHFVTTSDFEDWRKALAGPRRHRCKHGKISGGCATAESVKANADNSHDLVENACSVPSLSNSADVTGQAVPGRKRSREQLA